MREKKRENARAQQEESARLAAKEAAQRRDKTLWEYLERAERQTDAGMFLELAEAGAAQAKEFTTRKRFVN